MVIGDMFSSIFQSLSLPDAFSARSNVIVIIAAVVLYPLCCLRSFSQLAKFSLLGTLATTYVVGFVLKRFFDGSYAFGGMFYNASAAASSVASAGSLVSPQLLILVSILSTAYLVHFNAPQFYSELRPARTGLGASEKAEKLARFKRVALAGFGAASLQYAAVMAFGFLTFGKATQGNLLLNYASNDALAAAARVAIGISTLFGYPMQFAGFRDGILEVLKKENLPDGPRRVVTALLLSLAIGFSCLFRDLGQFNAIEGALLASFLIFAAPPIMCLRMGLSKGFWGRLGHRAQLALSLIVGGIGCVVTLGWL